MFSLEIPSVPVAEFPAAAKNALASLAGLNDEEQAQAKVAVGQAIGLVKQGQLGSSNVSAVIGGHANPGHESVPGGNDSIVTLQITAHPSPGHVRQVGEFGY